MSAIQVRSCFCLRSFLILHKLIPLARSEIDFLPVIFFSEVKEI